MLGLFHGIGSHKTAQVGAAAAVFTLPPYYPWAPTFTIFESGSVYTTDYDPASDKPAPTATYYVDPVSGNDTTGNGSSGNPYKSLSKANTQGASNVTRIIAKGGLYNDSTGFAAAYSPTASRSLESWDGAPVIVTRALNNPSFAAESAPNGNTYSVALTPLPVGVVDRTYGRNGTNSGFAAEYLVDGATPVPIAYKRVYHAKSTVNINSGTLVGQSGLPGLANGDAFTVKSSTNAGAATTINISGTTTRTQLITAINAVANVFAEVTYESAGDIRIAISTRDGGNLVLADTSGTPLADFGITAGTTDIRTVVQANAASWAWDGVKIFVKTHDSRAPDGNLVVLPDVAVTQMASSITFWASMCEFWGRQPIAGIPGTSNTQKIVLVDCGGRFCGTPSGTSYTDNLYTSNTKNRRFVRCAATDCFSGDGFSIYAASNTVRPHSLLLNCYAARNGTKEGLNHNGFTTHINADEIRLNCVAKNNYGPNFIDIFGSNSLNLGCTSISSLGLGTANEGFSCGSANGNILSVGYYKNCTETGSTRSRAQSTGGYWISLGGYSGTGTSNGTITDGTVIANQDAIFKPANTVAPVVSGTATQGQTLSCTTGTWTGYADLSYTYQWKRSGANIGGATSSTYLLVLADVGSTISCEVTAANYLANASTPKISNSTGVVT